MKRTPPHSALTAILFSLLTLPHTGHGAPPPDLIAAIKKGDVTKAKTLLQTPGQVVLRDERGNTALHWAALANDASLVLRLIEAGADVRATNDAGATPLHYGVGSAQIVTLLLKAGVDPSARSLAGNTPLHCAAARPESFPQVKQLLDAGAEADAVRIPSSPFEAPERPLSVAAFAGDERTVRLLLDRGAVPGSTGAKDSPLSPVAAATFGGREQILKLLVSRGASVNCDDGFAGHALNIAAYAGHTHLVPFILEHGADLQQTSSFGERVPPMVWAAYNESGDPTLARALVARGVDINQTTSAGNTALGWALRSGETPLVEYLRSQGAVESPSAAKRKQVPGNPVPENAAERESMLRAGVQRAIHLLQRSSDGFLDNGFVKQAACVSCHQQTLPAVTFALARERGFAVDESSLARQLSAQQAGWSKTRDRAYEMHAPQPAAAAVLGYGLHGFRALRYQADELTESMAWYLAETQMPDGSWPDFDFRPPMEAGPIVGTALTVRALQFYPPAVATQPLKNRIQKARKWLERARPANLSQQVFRYHGLGWAGATASELARETKELLAMQRPDGGWAALPKLESDSWATGHVLVALHQAGGLPTSHPAYQRGVEFLLRTQFEDGSWWVKSRTWPFQPHFDSGFPHGKDQWISAGGTAWAAMALVLSLAPTASAESFPTAQELIERSVERPSAPETASAVRSSPSVASTVDFSRDVRPILERSCLGCHSGEKPKGGYDLSGHDTALKGGQSGEPAIVPGHVERTPLLRFVRDQVEDLEMPPLAKREKFPPLSAGELEVLTGWIAQGASWPAGETLRAVEK